MYAEVLIEYGVKSLDKSFTYIIPEFLKDVLQVGMKVLIPFGKKTINGFVTNIKYAYEDEYELKEIIDVIDKELVLDKEMLEMGSFLQEKTLCSLITAYKTMLPSSLKVKTQKRDFNLYESFVVVNTYEEDINNYIEENPRAKKQIEILNTVMLDKEVPKKSIAGSSLDVLLAKGLLKIKKVQKYRINSGYNYNFAKPTLTDEQQMAVDKVSSHLNESKTFLIHGVTGSGKTEIYFSLIDKVLEMKKTALVLVPEITLTTQIVKRFYDRFGASVAIFHSALSEGEKYDEYLKILRGEVSIVVGTRSAIFVPLKNLGIIIIDEEHSENYKQDNNPRYNTLDMAEFRSKYNNIPLVLGSATPTLESMARAKKGVYELITLEKRVGDAVLPEVTIVDMEPEMRKRNLIFSEILTNKINDRLEKQEQIILLLNRRGYSTIITCGSCGFTYTCPHCDISLTYHKTSNNLRCHYCGYTILKAEKCPECHEEALNYYGLGTEKLEMEIKKKFPSANVVRMDTDTTQNKGSHERIISGFKNGNYDILLGTQMISKGLDFPRVTLVGVINADSSLNIPDFRSSEKTFSLLNQVAGRAGRSELKGEVIIQTFNPDNKTIECVKNQNYNEFYNYEMNIRKTLKYPPYYYLASVKITSKDYDVASTEIKKVYNYLKNNIDKTSLILGPTTAAMFRVNNVYRFQIVVKYRFDDKLMNTLKDLDTMYINNGKANIEIDINPIRI